MKPFSILLSLFLLGSLASCDPEKQAKHRTSAIVEMRHSSIERAEDKFIGTQVALLKTKGIIEAAGLKADLSPDTILSSLEITPTQGTNLITITASHDDKGLPRTIVSAVLESYSDSQKESQEGSLQDQLHALAKAITTQHEKVVATRKDFGALTARWGIPHVDESEATPLVITEELMFRQIRQKLASLETRHDQVEIQVTKIAGTPDHALLEYVAGIDLPGNPITSLFHKYNKTKEKIEALKKSGMPEEHPDIVDLRAEEKVAFETAQTELGPLEAILKTKLEMINRQIERMGKMINDRLSDRHGIGTAMKLEKYNTAKEEYEDARAILRQLKLQEIKLQSFLITFQPLIIHRWDHQ